MISKGATILEIKQLLCDELSLEKSESTFSRMNIRQKSANPGTTYAEDEQAGFNFYLVGDFFYDIAEETGREGGVNKTNVSILKHVY